MPRSSASVLTYLEWMHHRLGANNNLACGRSEPSCEICIIKLKALLSSDSLVSWGSVWALRVSAAANKCAGRHAFLLIRTQQSHIYRKGRWQLNSKCFRRKCSYETFEKVCCVWTRQSSSPLCPTGWMFAPRPISQRHVFTARRS